VTSDNTFLSHNVLNYTMTNWLAECTWNIVAIFCPRWLCQ